MSERSRSRARLSSELREGARLRRQREQLNDLCRKQFGKRVVRGVDLCVVRNVMNRLEPRHIEIQVRPIRSRLLAGPCDAKSAADTNEQNRHVSQGSAIERKPLRNDHGL